MVILMDINARKIADEVKRLNTFIDSYNDLTLKMYNSINNASFMWKSTYSQSFFSYIPFQKNDCKDLLDELISIRDVYVYIYESYLSFGEKVSFDLSNFSSILSMFGQYISKCNTIISQYNALFIEFCPEERRLLRKERKALIAHRNRVVQFKAAIRKDLEKIEEIEKNVRNRISRLTIKVPMQMVEGRFYDE